MFCVIKIQTKKKVKSLLLDTGIFVDADETNNTWVSNKILNQVKFAKEFICLTFSSRKTIAPDHIWTELIDHPTWS